MRIFEPILSALGIHFSGATQLSRSSTTHSGSGPQIEASDRLSIQTATQRRDAFWRGRSGRLYRHQVHALLTCPAPVRSVYVLANRDASGRAKPLFAGVAASTGPTLNLAHIRRRGAQLGASEVHILEMPHAAGSLRHRRIAQDLRAAFALQFS